MKRLSTALVLFILLGFVMVTVTGCVTYAKLFGIIPNTDSYLADFKPLVGKDYYLRADILSCSSQDEFTSSANTDSRNWASSLLGQVFTLVGLLLMNVILPTF